MGNDKKLTEFFEGTQQVNQIDWTGIDEDTQYLTHGLHPYPARMPPHIARQIINMYSKDPKDVVLDPFCGSGGVLVEALIHDRSAIGVDLNPLAVLIAKVKTTPLKPEVLYEARQLIIENSTKRLHAHNFSTPNIKNLSFWFKPEAIDGLSAIKEELDEVEKAYGKDIADFFKVSFSLTVREVSNLRKGEFKLYRKKASELERFHPNPLKAFSEITLRNIQKMSDFYYEMLKHPNSKVQIFKGDSRKLLEFVKERSVSLVVTSPPYGDSHTTVAYGQFSRYSLLWLGFPEKEVYTVDKQSLGGQVVNKEKDLESPTLNEVISKIESVDQKRAKEVYSYFYDADLTLEQVALSLKKDAYCAYVVANRTVRRVKVPTDQILIEIGKKYGLEHIVTYKRQIPNKYIPYKNAPENVQGLKGETMANEHILVWKISY